jgi:hypothetical protein
LKDTYDGTEVACYSSDTLQVFPWHLVVC